MSREESSPSSSAGAIRLHEDHLVNFRPLDLQVNPAHPVHGLIQGFAHNYIFFRFNSRGGYRGCWLGHRHPPPAAAGSYYDCDKQNCKTASHSNSSLLIITRLRPDGVTSVMVSTRLSTLTWVVALALFPVFGRIAPLTVTVVVEAWHPALTATAPVASLVAHAVPPVPEAYCNNASGSEAMQVAVSALFQISRGPVAGVEAWLLAMMAWSYLPSTCVTLFPDVTPIASQVSAFFHVEVGASFRPTQVVFTLAAGLPFVASSASVRLVSQAPDCVAAKPCPAANG